jgi:hypothetical protein
MATEARFLPKSPTRNPQLDSRHRPNADSDRAHQRRHHSLVFFPCYQSRWHQKLILVFFRLAQTARSSRHAWRKLAFILAVDCDNIYCSVLYGVSLCTFCFQLTFSLTWQLKILFCCSFFFLHHPIYFCFSLPSMFSWHPNFHFSSSQQTVYRFAPFYFTPSSFA